MVRISSGIVAENISIRFSAGVAERMPADILHEPHVEHLIGFIENCKAESVKRKGSALHQVDHTPGRSDCNINSLLQLFQLDPDKLSAIERRDAERRSAFEGVQFFGDLKREFPGRSQDQSARSSVSAGDRVDDGDSECGGFSGTGLRLSDHILFPFEQQRDRLFLNRRRLFEPLLLERRKNAFGNSECAKCFKMIHGLPFLLPYFLLISTR